MILWTPFDESRPDNIPQNRLAVWACCCGPNAYEFVVGVWRKTVVGYFEKLHNVHNLQLNKTAHCAASYPWTFMSVKSTPHWQA